MTRRSSLPGRGERCQRPGRGADPELRDVASTGPAGRVDAQPRDRRAAGSPDRPRSPAAVRCAAALVTHREAPAAGVAGGGVEIVAGGPLEGGVRAPGAEPGVADRGAVAPGARGRRRAERQAARHAQRTDGAEPGRDRASWRYVRSSRGRPISARTRTPSGRPAVAPPLGLGAGPAAAGLAARGAEPRVSGGGTGAGAGAGAPATGEPVEGGTPSRLVGRPAATRRRWPSDRRPLPLARSLGGVDPEPAAGLGRGPSVRAAGSRGPGSRDAATGTSPMSGSSGGGSGRRIRLGRPTNRARQPSTPSAELGDLVPANARSAAHRALQPRWAPPCPWQPRWSRPGRYSRPPL